MHIPPAPAYQDRGSGGNLIRFFQTRDRFDLIIALGLLIYSALFSWLSLIRYNTNQLEFDFAIFHQAFWNTITGGGILTNSLEGGSHFGVHFSPILFTLIPIYAVIPAPHTLLIAQSILLSLGAIPVYLVGRKMLGKELGCIMGLLYLLYPGVHGINLYDFHEVAFLPFLLGMALWAFLTGRKNYLIIFCFLSLLVKEDVALTVLMIGLLGLYQTRRDPLPERWQYVMIILGSLGVLFTFFLVIRLFFAVPGATIESGSLQQYMDLGTNLSQHTGNRIAYLLMVFLPLLFLPLGSPSVLVISIPSFLEILLSPSPYYYSIYYQYSALILPILFMASICTFARIQRSPHPARKNLVIPIICLMIITSLACTAWYSPARIMSGEIQNMDMKAIEGHDAYLDHIISKIPDDVSIATQLDLLPRISTHKNIITGFHEDADIILIDAALPKRAAVFNDDIGKINERFDLLSHVNNLYIFVNRSNPTLKNELEKAL